LAEAGCSLCGIHKNAAHSISNLYAVMCMSVAVGLTATIAMTEKAHRFSKSAIEELNRHPDDIRRLPTRLFALLMLGLTGLLLLFYLLIVTPR
jgi:hypothetical protein